jgi:formiminotetrahydrofolate cyclodeaminase
MDTKALLSRHPRLPDVKPAASEFALSTSTFRHTPVSKLLQAISDGPEMPGCGSAAALSGALAASVVAAAAVGTLHNKDHIQFHARAEEIRSMALQRMEELLAVVDSDAKLFSHWQELLPEDAYKLEALQAICRSPLRSAKLGVELVQLSLELLQQGADSILTDAATSFASGVGCVEANLCIAYGNALYLPEGERAKFHSEIGKIRDQLVGFVRQRNLFATGLGGNFAGLPLLESGQNTSGQDISGRAGAPMKSSPA